MDPRALLAVVLAVLACAHPLAVTTVITCCVLTATGVMGACLWLRCRRLYREGCLRWGRA